MITGWTGWFIVIWTVILCGLMSIGGFFMFRKFLKKLPKSDGMSILDWEDYYIQQTLPLWTQDMKNFLEELVNPVPELFRDVARNKIAGKIGELALQKKATEITMELVIEGYIVATPKRDHKFLRKHLEQKQIDTKPYEHFFNA
ncbi:MAG: DUF2621 domain-containing protein [Bacillaceae bacterium]